MRKGKKFMIKLIAGMAIISIISILLIVFTELNHIVIAYTDMTTIIVFSIIMLKHGFKKGIINWR